MDARPAAPPRQYKYYEWVMVGFVTVYLCSNLIGPAKAATLDLPLLGAVTFGAGVLFFPISYVFGDILTEVYGYSRARRVIWAGFGAMIFAAVMAFVVVSLPPAPGWPKSGAANARCWCATPTGRCTTKNARRRWPRWTR